MFINHCITLIYIYYKVIHIMLNHFNYWEDDYTESRCGRDSSGYPFAFPKNI